jgi:hypothetical protein
LAILEIVGQADDLLAQPFDDAVAFVVGQVQPQQVAGLPEQGV